MKRYAMVLLNIVIDIIESDEIPVYPHDPEGNEVTAVECPDNIQVGDEYKEGEFILIGDRITPEPTQLDRIEEQQLILMEAQAEQYEQDLENRLNDMEVQATIYEAVLSLGGEK